MSYVVIARKYRPQEFSDVVGQEHITRTLKNAIKLDKVSHAYLFCGPRGVGKTTTARIFAKAINCDAQKNEEPCNKCSMCTEITNSQSVDIIEIDAASNRGIDDIRRLRENIKFAPAKAAYKVYIIDEVHMLTKEAFNAILKTLEEPPAHVIFILATTEPEKVLDTITSRCQKYNFKLITEKEIQQNLKKIAEKEKIKCDEEALWLIAKAANGSIRDAQSIMDQAISFSQEKMNAESVRNLLGLIPRNVLFSYTDYIVNEDIKGALKLTEDLIRDGYNVLKLFNELLMHFRNIMYASVFGKITGFLGLSMEYSEKLDESAKKFSKERLVWIIEFLIRNTQRIKYTENSHVVLDTIMFKLCQKYVSLEDILNTAEDVPNIKEKLEKTVKSTAVKKQDVVRIPESVPVSKLVEKPKNETRGTRWSQVLNLIKKESQPLFHLLKGATATLKRKAVIIRYAGLLTLTERQSQILKDKIIRIMGEGYYPEVIKENTKNEAEVFPIEEELQIDKEFNPAKIEEDEPVVGKIIDVFEGRIEK